ncbi:ROK family protein [Virgibacillus sp. AGTR]|nr:ROK family protein [Virgibacillus sp. AGTR]
MIKQVFGEATTPENIFQRAKSGEQACISMINDWTKQIAAGLAQIILLFDPKCLLIGGGLSQQGDYLLNYVKTSYLLVRHNDKRLRLLSPFFNC